MMWFPNVAGSALLISTVLFSTAQAEMLNVKMFGKDVAVTTDGDGQTLTVGGVAMVKDRYVSLDQIGIVAGVPIALGTSSAGGNACEGSTFVVSFPPDAAARLDGPLTKCVGIGAELTDDRIKLSTAAIPGRDGQRWDWTPDVGFRETGTTTFEPDSAKGWTELRERTANHPADLLDHAEIGRRITQLAGPDGPLVLRILTGVGSAEFKGDWFVGRSCTPHMCTFEEAIVAASLSERQVYLAWKPDGDKIVVRPPVGDWPEPAKVELREWAAKWK